MILRDICTTILRLQQDLEILVIDDERLYEIQNKLDEAILLIHKTEMEQAKN